MAGFTPGMFGAIAQGAKSQADKMNNPSSPSTGNSGPSSRQRSADPNDPEIIEGIRLSDLNAVMQMQQKLSAIQSNPQLKATVDPMWLMALGVGVQRKTQEILGKLVGENNVQTLMDAMQGNLYQGPGQAPLGITGGIYGQQAYAQKLGQMQKRADAMWHRQQPVEFNNMFEPDQNAKPDSKGQVSWNTRKDVPAWQQQLYGGSEPPAWFKALPVEQQLSLMGAPEYTKMSDLNVPSDWQSPKDAQGHALAPGFRYDAKKGMFERESKTTEEPSSRPSWKE